MDAVSAMTGNLYAAGDIDEALDSLFLHMRLLKKC
jgi:hypothetical protein